MVQNRSFRIFFSFPVPGKSYDYLSHDDSAAKSKTNLNQSVPALNLPEYLKPETVQHYVSNKTHYYFLC